MARSAGRRVSAPSIATAATISMPSATERMSVIALDDLGTIRAWSREILDENRKTAQELLTPREDLRCFFPPYGTVVFPRLMHGSVDALYQRLLSGYDTAIAPGEFFGLPDHFRLGLGGTPESFRTGVERLCAALDSHP